MPLEVARTEESRYRRLDALVTSEHWINEQAYRLAGWEMLLIVAKGRDIEPIDHLELCDRIGFPKVLTTIKKIKGMKL